MGEHFDIVRQQQSKMSRMPLNQSYTNLSVGDFCCCNVQDTVIQTGESIKENIKCNDCGKLKPSSIEKGVDCDRAAVLLPKEKQKVSAQGVSQKSGFNLCRILLAILAIIFGMTAIIINLSTVTFSNDDRSVNHDNVLVAFDTHLPKMKEKFMKQSKSTWASIKTALRMTIKENPPKSPGIISLIPVEGASNTVQCLAKALAKALQKSYNDTNLLEIDGDKIEKFEDRGKIELEQKIRHSLEKDDYHVVLISNVDRLSASTGMALHGLCDTDNAPFKQVIYIFTVDRPSNEDAVDAQVTTAWKSQLTEEQRQSIESRIGNNMVIVLPETKETLEQIC